MSHVAYQASLARRNELLRAAADRRRAAEVLTGSRRARQIARARPAGARFMRRVRRAVSPAGPRPAMP